MEETRDVAVAEAAAPPTVSVVICAYTLDRWDDLVASVESVTVEAQREAGGASVILVIDHNAALLARATARWPRLDVLASDGPPGLSGARNTGVHASRSDIVAFLDDDAVAEPGWLGRLVAPYADPRVVGTGGWAEAAWDRGRPRWFPREFDWVVGCSYRGLPERPAPIRNPIGCAMSFRRSVLDRAGGFRSEVGRIGPLPVGDEETELSIRVQRVEPAGLIVHVPAARVRHRVPGARSTWSYFRSRCYQEGRSKALISLLVGARAGLASERSYATRTLPRGVLRGVSDALRGDLAGLSRAAAITAGLAITTAGYLAGRLGWDALPVAVDGAAVPPIAPDESA